MEATQRPRNPDRSTNTIGWWQFILATAIGVLLSVAGILSFIQKPWVPVRPEIVVAVAPPPNASKPAPIAIDNATVLELYLDGHRIGEQVRIQVREHDSLRLLQLQLQPQYRWQYVVIVAMAGILYFGLGLFVALRRPNDSAARLFYVLTLAIGLLITTTSGGYTVLPARLGQLTYSVFLACYTFGGLLLFHFALVFPIRSRHRRAVLTVLYAVAALLALGTIYTFNRTVWNGFDPHHAVLYATLFESVRWFMLLLLLGSLVRFVTTYRMAATHDARLKLRWVLYGWTISVLSFAALRLVPGRLGWQPPISEEMSILLATVAPITVAIAIARHRLLDIDLLIRRSTIYAIVIAVLLMLYAGVVFIASIFVTHIHAAAAVMVALLFEPLRRLVRRFVDQVFFRSQYDYRRAVIALADRLGHAGTMKDLGTAILEGLDRLLAPERLAVVHVLPGRNRVSVLAHRRLARAPWKSLSMDFVRHYGTRSSLVAHPSHVEPEVPTADSGFWTNCEDPIALVRVEALGGTGSLLLIALGPRRSGQRYSEEDVDLIGTLGAQANVMAQQILLQMSLLLQQAESDRLRELNELKSNFVASVSHELKTPLTSIRMFAELLETPRRHQPETVWEYARVIAAESQRLQRLIENVLDHARSEAAPRSYQTVAIDLNLTALEALESMHYIIASSGFSAGFDASAEPLMITGEPDALRRTVINLISNAVKYGGQNRRIDVRTFQRGTHAGVSVSDHGIGIAPEDQHNLFEPFFRTAAGAAHAAGTGIGLSLVRQIVEAHSGLVELESAPGHGSTFTLLFPLQIHHETNTAD